MRILFLGEGDLSGPARYLAAALRWLKIPFDHRPDQVHIPKTWFRKQYDAVILSDYRYVSFTPEACRWLIKQVTEGTGLLMIGGWASFTGWVGGYAGTPIEALLPVFCIRGDDRVQKASGAVIENVSRRLFLSLDWHCPPVICGYHKARVKASSQVVLQVHDLCFESGKPSLGSARPLLVFGQAGLGRTVALLTDCAPHWAGGLIDWGKRRIGIQVGQGVNVEVGEHYLRFIDEIVMFLIRKEGLKIYSNKLKKYPSKV